MMQSRWSKWLSGVGGVVLIGGLVLANYSGGVMPAEAHNGYQNPFKGYQNPFKQILSKLNIIIEKLNTGGGGTRSSSTGGGAGYQSLSWDTHNPLASRFTIGGLRNACCNGQQHRAGVGTDLRMPPSPRNVERSNPLMFE